MILALRVVFSGPELVTWPCLNLTSRRKEQRHGYQAQALLHHGRPSRA